MVSYYNSVAMFSRASGHPHGAGGISGNYFPQSYGSYPGGGPSSHQGHHHAQASNGDGVVVGNVIEGGQYSPNLPPVSEFNCNQNYHQYADPAAVAAVASANSWGHHYSACHRGYEDWAPQNHHQNPPTINSAANYYSQQVSLSAASVPSSSPPSPNCSLINHGNGIQSNSSSPYHPPHHIQHVQNVPMLKLEFGPFGSVEAGGNCSQAENTSLEIGGQEQGGGGSRSGRGVLGSGTPSLRTPHSPDSGMAISDGMSSTGSPATTAINQQQQHQQQQGGLTSGNSGHLAALIAAGTNETLMAATQSVGKVMLSPSGSSNHPAILSAHHQHLPPQRPTQARSPFEWMKKPSYGSSHHSSNGKTRTKDKYRVVYSDTQRLELEKEFHYSRYITIRRKAELASILGLSERQVKIWFQNRRAKERKLVRKREEMIHREKIASIVHLQNVANV